MAKSKAKVKGDENVKADPVDKKQEALQVLETERLERQESCRNEVDAILQKYGCAFASYTVLRAGSIEPYVEIVAQ